MTEAKPSLKRTLIGKVVSDKRAKTVTVLVERRVKHPIYDKIMIKSSKYHAHDEQGEYHLGDLIEITESRPISKSKNWIATRLVEKAAGVVPQIDDEALDLVGPDLLRERIDGLESEAVDKAGVEHRHQIAPVVGDLRRAGHAAVEVLDGEVSH